jgi:(2Fe-2S) ferredoxin
MPPSDFRAYVCCGPNCTERGSPRLIDVLQAEVDAAGLSAQVEVMPGGCQKHCERGPSLVIWPGPTHYEFIDPARLRRIVREHLREGRPARDLLYQEPGPPRRRLPLPPVPRRSDYSPNPAPGEGGDAARGGRTPYPFRKEEWEPRPTDSPPPGGEHRRDSPKPRRPPREVDDLPW